MQHSSLRNANVTRNAMRQLRRLDAYRLFEDSLQFTLDNDRMTVFKPSIEPTSATAFITENPKTIWKSGDFKQRPLLMSFVDLEGGWINSLLKARRSQEALSYNLEEDDDFLRNLLELRSDNVRIVKERYFANISTERDTEKALLQVNIRFIYRNWWIA